MSDIEITPDLLRAVADWYVERKNHRAFADIVTELREDANLMEARAAEEKRIDELAQAFIDGRHAYSAIWASWDSLEESDRDAHRAGIRAVLAKLDEKKADVEVKPVGWYRSMELDFAHKHFGFPPWGGGRVTASDGGVWEWENAGQYWELREYGSSPEVRD